MGVKYWVFYYSDKDGWEGPLEYDSSEKAENTAFEKLKVGYSDVVVTRLVMRLVRGTYDDEDP